MPIQEKDLGKYKRPAIYIEEIDNSLIELPAQNVLINLVPGFSKKGPFNRPVYVDNKVDFERIFGTIDRQLENKGSYFHRTCLKMLESGPIWALNLLSTVPERDILNYVSISTTAIYQNSDITNQYTAPFERFFNRQDFWVRDEESFLDVVNENGDDLERLLHLTNMGDRKITTFLYKSNIVGFDVTAREWYGGDDKVPLYIHPKSMMSDYMITVLILAGDWTNYTTLSTDTTWSRYFNINGLIIENIQDFVNERGVTLLGGYDVSLIPNFKDLNNRDMYIKNVINNNTDKTGLFCTYNQDLLLDSDNLTNLIDLIGNSIIGLSGEDSIDEINFLSYHQTIKENKEYPLVDLDSPNNVFGNGTFGSQTHVWNNWTQYGIANPTFSNNDTFVTTVVGGAAVTYIINGVKYELTDSLYTLAHDEVDDGFKRKDVIYLDSTGVNVMTGTIVASGDTSIDRNITFNNYNTIILGTMEITNDGGTINGVYSPITTDSDSISITTSTGVNGTQNYLSISFDGTSGGTILNNEYDKLRSKKVYEEIVSYLEGNKLIIIKDDGSEKTYVESNYLVKNTDLVSGNYEIWIYLDTPANYTNTNDILLYYRDIQLKLANNFTEAISTTILSGTSIIGLHSDLYTDFYNGVINTGDHIEEDGESKLITMYIDDNGDISLSVEGGVTDASEGIIIKSNIGNLTQTVEIEDYIINEETDYPHNVVAIKVDRTRYSEVRRGSYLEADYDEDIINDRRLVRVVNVTNESDTNLKILYTDGPVLIKSSTDNVEGKENLYTTTHTSVYNYATTLKGVALNPFVLHTDSIPNGTETRLNTILNVIGKSTALYKGLVNKNKISWRYLIDSFGLGLAENSKQQYLDLTGKKLNCFGFINMPSAKQFKKSNNPNFTAADGSLSTTFMKQGADLESNPDFLYSFGQGVGRSTTGYFFPYVKVSTDGIPSFVPPAAWVASAYMRKFTTTIAGIQPWTIAAGVNMGRVPDIVGTEIDFSEDDLDNFAEMGTNPITFIRNVGYIINDENTSQVFPISSLSYIHSREVLIELENELYDMLLRYQWKFNTPTIRSEIKYRADRICQKFVDAEGLYAYRNIIDESNNTPYIIDLQGGVLDTHVEIVKGMGWIVNNITIERTGTINSTGFRL